MTTLQTQKSKALNSLIEQIAKLATNSESQAERAEPFDLLFDLNIKLNKLCSQQ